MKAREVNRLRARIARLRGAGMGATRIAAEAGCTRSAVYKALKAGGADRRAGRGRRLPSEVRRAVRRLVAGRAAAAAGGGRQVAAWGVRCGVAARVAGGPVATRSECAPRGAWGGWARQAAEAAPAPAAAGAGGSRQAAEAGRSPPAAGAGGSRQAAH